MHPNLTRLDAVEPVTIDAGPLRGTRFRLGPAGGARRIGLSRYVLGPGERAMPVHVHADEEELFFVLGGSGISWQDGRTWRVGAGDLLVHLPQGAAHALVAGEEGLDVLAFGTGSDTGMTWLPRARTWWMGPHWLPDDGPDPFAAEAAAGPLELPAPEAGPPPHRASVASGLSHRVLEPGRLSGPPHWHSAEEECFVVLEAGGEARLGDEVLPLEAGAVLFRPPGTGVAHALRGGPGGMTYLAYGTRVPGDLRVYPDSKEITVGGHARFRIEPLDH